MWGKHSMEEFAMGRKKFQEGRGQDFLALFKKTMKK